MTSPRMSVWFETKEEADEMLGKADEHTQDAYEEELVTKFIERFEEWGLETFMSEGQYEAIARIAHRGD